LFESPFYSISSIQKELKINRIQPVVILKEIGLLEWGEEKKGKIFVNKEFLSLLEK